MMRRKQLQRIFVVMARRLFKNRHGDTQSFEWTEDRNILWRGSRSHERITWDPHADIITMVDPAGGPYLAKGDVIDFPEEFAGYTIKHFERHDEGYIIHV